jgi:hypothetical protein
VVVVLPGIANVARDIIPKIGEFLSIDFGLELGSFGASGMEKFVADRDVDVDAQRVMPVWNMAVANRSPTDDTEAAHSLPPVVVSCRWRPSKLLACCQPPASAIPVERMSTVPHFFLKPLSAFPHKQLP